MKINFTWRYPYYTVLSATTCSCDVACLTSSVTPTSLTKPVGAPKLVSHSPFSSAYSGATARYSHGFPGSPRTTTYFGSTISVPETLTYFGESPGHSRSFLSSPFAMSSVSSKLWFPNVIDSATCALRFGEAAVVSPTAPQRNLRSNTIQQPRV